MRRKRFTKRVWRDYSRHIDALWLPEENLPSVCFYFLYSLNIGEYAVFHAYFGPIFADPIVMFVTARSR